MTRVPVRITEQEYADLAAACDRLLRAPDTSLARLAVPALHFLNEHPSSLAQYASVIDGRSEGGAIPGSPRVGIHMVRGLMRSLATRRPVPHRQGPVDVVIVSHLIKPDQLRQDDDFYFGALQSRLREQGVASLLILISHLKAARSEDIQPAFPRMILPRTVSPAIEANLWRQCSSAWNALRREAADAGHSIDGRLALLASRQALSESTMINLRMHAAVASLCQAVDPKIVVTTYEGTVAERLIWHAARTARRRPLCVGYQHALVLQRAHAIRRSVAARGIDCDPDIILTLGAASHAVLAASAGLQPMRLIEYGSHRRAPLPVLPRPQDRPRRCLVLPDASDQECATLFNFALRCARYASDIGFVLRPHPMIELRSLLRRYPDLQKLPANVSLSADKPLEQEFAQARYCLYRGSSAALYAVRAAIKPYYLAQAGELPVDCLFSLTDWRETVTSPEELIERILFADTSAESLAAGRAMSVCERYVSAVKPSVVNELLTALR